MSKRPMNFCFLLSAVFTVCAIAAPAANAAPNWTVAGAALGSGISEEGNETATLTKFGSETVVHFKITVPTFLTLTCTGKKMVGVRIIGPGQDSANSITYSGCKVLGSKEESTVCTVTSEKGADGTIKFVKVTSQLKRNAMSFTYDYFNFSEGETLATIEIGSCALSGNYKLTGSFALKPEYNTNAVSLGFETSQAIQESAGASLKFGVRNAYMQGRFDLTLKSGKTWGVTP